MKERKKGVREGRPKPKVALIRTSKAKKMKWVREGDFGPFLPRHNSIPRRKFERSL